MSKRSCVYTCARAAALAVALSLPVPAAAADILVPAGGNLQAAINAARPGDTILLAPGATYVGNFVLPVHGGTTHVTIRTAGNDALLPGPGTRITPAHAPYLAKLRSPSNVPVLRTAARAAYWRVMLLEFLPNANGAGDIMQLGNPSAAQNSLDLVPHHLVVDRVYMHGDPLVGQKRGIHLNSADTEILNSHIDEMKAIGQDTQALGGANGPGRYRIENNHLEAAGEVFILGGDDPKIPGLVTADVIFRGNTLRRPVSWRDPIVPAPAGVTATAGTGASLAAGTYAYRVVARRPAGTTTATSPRSLEASAVVGAGGSVTVRWTAVPNATSYRVFGRTPGGQTMYWTVQTTSFTDTGAAGTSGTPPARGTVWQVKNLFELKNARRVQVDYNLMENNWEQAQVGTAVLFSVRNQYGGCLQCVVEDVTFEYNIVRNTGSGIKVLGYDYNYPSQQSNNIRIRHNLFYGIDRAWGGTGYFLILTEGPRDIVVDHNTIVSTNGLGVVSIQGPPVYGFVFTNNVARHNSYGIFGSGRSFGNGAISYYFPNGVIRRNVLAGGRATSYPADNLFPTTSVFEGHFVDYAAADFALRPATDWAGAGTDAADLGADIARLRGTPREDDEVEPLSVLTGSLPATTVGASYSAILGADGGVTPYRWGIGAGSLPAGISLDPLTGRVAGTASVAGDFAFTARVTDNTGASASRQLVLRTTATVAPLAILTPTLARALATRPYSQQLEAAGGRTPYQWSVTAGALPAGMSLSSAGVLSGTPGAAGSWSITVRVSDDAGSAVSKAFTLRVDPPAIPPVEILTTALAEAEVTRSYAQQLEATGGLGTYRWSVASGPLPPGLTLSAGGLLAGTPTTAGGWSITLTVQDAQDSSRRATSAFWINVEPINRLPSVSLRVSPNGVVPVGSTVTFIADAVDTDGVVSKVDFYVSGLRIATVPSAPFAAQWVALEGPHAATAVAFDGEGGQTTSAPVTVQTTPEIVLYASDAQEVLGDLQLVQDSTAARGVRLWNPNRNAAMATAAAVPASYAEFTFYAEAWRPYRIWIRGSAEANTATNDSAYLQFSGALDPTGRITSRIGTTAAMSYSVEEYAGAALQGWGWQDNGYGPNVNGPVIYFERTGLQTLRIQPREDGLSIDQIIISPGRYFSLSPGLPRNDRTIVAKP